MLLTSMEPASQVTIKGTVTGTDGAPLSGVIVTVKGSGNSTTTNSSGNYTLSVGPEAKVLLFSLKGICRELFRIRDTIKFTR